MIGYHDTDWGMAGYYAREDYRQALDDIAEQQYTDELQNFKDNETELMKFVRREAAIFRAEAIDSGDEEYETGDWRVFLADGAAWESHSLNQAVMFAIREEEDFTYAEAIDGLAAEWQAEQKAA